MDQNTQASSPVAIVIFGVTGDLTRRKLVPALYELVQGNCQPAPLYIFGFARRDWDDDHLRSILRQGVLEFARKKPVDETALNRLLGNTHYLHSSFEDLNGYQQLSKLLDKMALWNRLFYLATPPEAYSAIIQKIGAAHLVNCPGGWTRIVIEKPYGQDLTSAQALDTEVHRVFDESQVYRIDHYLGKETVQNILVFRFANGIFEPLWNRYHIDHVQVTVAEAVGVNNRAGYYESAGVIRDIFQNHILQLVTLTAMEAPVAFNAEAVRDEKLKVLRSLRPLRGVSALENTFRAQYTAGTIDGEAVPGYKDEKGVSPGSVTETLLGARLFIDNWRWADVPFYIRSGKRLPHRVTEIAIQFKQVPLSLFGWQNMAGNAPNMIVINIQPDEGIILTFGAKAPGPINQIKPVRMYFDYGKTFDGGSAEAYERLLLDAIIGDATLFTRTDEIMAAWAFTTDILNSWAEHPIDRIPEYRAGTWGPAGLDDFLRQHECSWRKIEDS